METKNLYVPNKKTYFPQIDSLRGLSFFAIFLFHTVRLPRSNFLGDSFIRFIYGNLHLGVEIFFVLSAFLLTMLAFIEYDKNGDFSFKNYFTRRALRIWPLYFLLLLISFLLIPRIAAIFNYNVSLPNAWFYIFFISNFYLPDHVFFLKILWTISVEEQFYLIWGLSLKFLKKRIKLIIGLLIMVSISFSIYALIFKISQYFNTLTYLVDFGFGALAATLLFSKNKISKWIAGMSPVQKNIFHFYLLFHFILFYFLDNYSTGLTNDFLSLLNRYVFLFYIALLLIEQVMNDATVTVLKNNKFLVYTGKLSYGLYCYHGLVITFINLLILKYSLPNVLMIIIYLILDFGVATISYYYFEKPFLSLKQRLRRI
ncbi:MAG TPA: acyltransferase [Hanamia sp.]|nr:acyltransferase [Hanamia sp.]